MTLFETIKATISMKQAAQHYGLNPNRRSCCRKHFYEKCAQRIRSQSPIESGFFVATAQNYGVKKRLCNSPPFHDDRHPSLNLNEAYFFCFGCGAKGDVIDFTSKLFHLSSYEAAEKLATDYCIRTDQRQTFSISSQPKHPHIRQFREDEMLCFHALSDYLYLLEEWKLPMMKFSFKFRHR